MVYGLSCRGVPENLIVCRGYKQGLDDFFMFNNIDLYFGQLHSHSCVFVFNSDFILLL